MCITCGTDYYRNNLLNGEMYVYKFIVYIGTLRIHYNIREFACEIFINSKLLTKNIPMDKLLFPLPKIKEKINNIVAYL